MYEIYTFTPPNNGLIPFLWNMFTTHQTVRGQQECDFSILGRYAYARWEILKCQHATKIDTYDDYVRMTIEMTADHVHQICFQHLEFINTYTWIYIHIYEKFSKVCMLLNWLYRTSIELSFEHEDQICLHLVEFINTCKYMCMYIFKSETRNSQKSARY